MNEELITALCDLTYQALTGEALKQYEGGGFIVICDADYIRACGIDVPKDLKIVASTYCGPDMIRLATTSLNDFCDAIHWRDTPEGYGVGSYKPRLRKSLDKKVGHLHRCYKKRKENEHGTINS